MALQTKTITGSTNNGNWTWKMDVIENSTSTSANTSSVTVNSYLGRSSSASYFGGTASVNITCNGDSRSTSKTFPYPTNVGAGGWVLVQSETFTVAHNADGSKSINISSSMSTGDFSPSSASASGSMALTTIPRYANITSLNVASATETSVTLKFTTDRNAWIFAKVNGGSWLNGGKPFVSNATSGSFTISGLSYNTKYNITVLCRALSVDSNLDTTKSIEATTYDIPYCTKTPNFTIGNDFTLEFYNPLGRSFEVRFVADNGSKISYDVVSGTKLSGWTSQSMIDRFYASIPNSKSGKYKVYTIWNGYEWTTKGTGTYSVKGTETPTFASGNLSYEDTNSLTVAITENNQHIVQNKSNLKVTYISATAKNSATISKYEFTLNNVTKSSTSAGGTVDFGTINSANNLTLSVKAIDSRGLSTTTTKTITMLAHSNPNAIVTLNRLNNYEDETHLTVDGSISSVNGKNAMTIQYRYKESDGSYNDFTTIEDNDKQTLSLDKLKEFVFNIKITDLFGGVYNREFSLGKGQFPLFIDVVKNSVGINKFPAENNSFECNNIIANNLTYAGSFDNDEDIVDFDDVTENRLKKSGLYTMRIGDNWYNLINVRHRNGYADGVKYGLQIRQKFDKGSILETRQHCNGTWTNWSKIETKTTIFSGKLLAGDIVILDNAKRFLDVYFSMGHPNGALSGKYIIDTTVNNVSYGSIVMMCHDSSSGLEYYTSESFYDKGSKTFTHKRTGYFNVSTGVFTNRNNSDAYRVYRIDTYD